MWKLIFHSVPGTSHQLSGKPCQDASGGRVVSTRRGDILIAACADGAGSAEHSDVGAALAVETVLDAMAEALGGEDFDERSFDRELLRDGCRRARRRVLDEAETRGVPARQLACTLLAAIVGEDWTAFAQVGDGVIVFDGPEGVEFAFWPDAGEYANTTRFLTDADFDAHIRFDRLDRGVRDLGLLTDGLQMLALDYAAGRAHTPFFEPIFKALGATEAVEVMRASLLEFLLSPRVNERTDDDKTLLLATRGPSTNHEPRDDATTA